MLTVWSYAYLYGGTYRHHTLNSNYQKFNNIVYENAMRYYLDKYQRCHSCQRVNCCPIRWDSPLLQIRTILGINCRLVTQRFFISNHWTHLWILLNTIKRCNPPPAMLLQPQSILDVFDTSMIIHPLPKILVIRVAFYSYQKIRS